MDLTRTIERYAAPPISHHVMIGLLKHYVDSNHKIHDPFFLANHILGPSYVSMESVLSYHGLIPERVYTTTSMTTKAACKYQTSTGVFSYTLLPLPYYAFGIRSVWLTQQELVMMASPEKALLDKIITTAGVEFRSRKSVLSYMEDDLRVDIDDLKQLDIMSMQSWISHAPKKRTLKMLITTLQRL